MNTKRNLKESASTVEVAISKSLCGGKLFPSEIEEIRHMTYVDLMSEHGLDSILAEKVLTHLESEIQRQRAQSLQTWQVDSRDTQKYAVRHVSPTNQIRESLEPGHDSFEIEDIMDIDGHHDKHSSSDHGRMLDYGKVKSDSHEGRMMRQALHEIGEYANDLHEMLNDSDDLPQWCHYKVAVARACVSKVKHYLEYKISHPRQK